jgi:sugar lactone lactonase YvrE
MTPAGLVSTVAGWAGTFGSADGTGTNAQFAFPVSVAVDAQDNIYTCDTYFSTIRKITPSGVVTTVAGQAGVGGSTDGAATNALFFEPNSVAFDAHGNLYVADNHNSTIRRISTNGIVSTPAGLATVFGSTDGLGAAARFNRPNSVAVDSAGTVYVADYYNNTIRKMVLDKTGTNWMVSTLAGLAGTAGSDDGIRSEARFSAPWGIGLDSLGNLFVADGNNDMIRRVTPDGVVTTIGGLAASVGTADGIGGNARFNNPTSPILDTTGGMYLGDSGNNTIRRGIPAGAPKITSPPFGLAVIMGGTAIFTVSAQDTTPVSYQWQFNGADLPGATSSTLTLTNVQPSQAGQYVVVVTSGTGVTSPSALLSVATPQPIQLQVLSTPTAAQFQLRVTGPAGANVSLEASTDLQSWLPLATNSLANGTFDFTDSDKVKFTQRLYRARTQ